MARILIIDDSGSMRSILKKIIVSAGHQVIGEGKDGSDAVEMFKQLRPDVMTLDIIMPGMDGLAALEAVMEADPSAAVVMVTSINSMDDAVRASVAGASGYILKPFDQHKVIAAIQAAIDASY